MGLHHQTARFRFQIRTAPRRVADRRQRNEIGNPYSTCGGQMKATNFSKQQFFRTGKRIVNARSIVVLLLLMALPLMAAERPGQRGDRGRGGGGGRESGGFSSGRSAARVEPNRPTMVDRFTHGSLRHAET